MNDRSAGNDHHDVTGLVDALITRALGDRATDIHFEPADEGLFVRYRVDGQLIDRESIPSSMASNVIARLKVLASLLTYRVDIPQEGGFRWSSNGTPGGSAGVDLRVATFPTVRGERAVVRVFGAGGEMELAADLGALGFSFEQCRKLHVAVAQPAGLILVNGPAGSGKTTTQYALLRHLRDHHPARSLITLEDPVERRINRVAQIQINPYGELNYEKCMRSLLRQDPQVILLGEVRDDRTAEVAIEAALTGHLILTTVHSSDPAETVVRFLEMGIAPYQLVSTLAMVCSQRLLRQKCHSCGSARGAARDSGLSAGDRAADPPCPECLGTGYRGRTAIAQTVMIDECVRGLILQQPTASVLRAEFKKQGPDLLDRGRALVSQGVTDEGELARVLGMI